MKIVEIKEVPTSLLTSPVALGCPSPSLWCSSWICPSRNTHGKVFPRLHPSVPPPHHLLANLRPPLKPVLWNWWASSAIQLSFSAAILLEEPNTFPGGDCEEGWMGKALVLKGVTKGDGYLLWGRYVRTESFCQFCAGMSNRRQLQVQLQVTVRIVFPPTHSLHINISLYPSVKQPEISVLEIHFFDF